METTGRQDTWSQEKGYIWSMIGSAVGFANVLSFSALCYKNGGGAFLIPYIIAHLVIGIPMLFLEGLIGQRTKLPIVSAMGNVGGRLAKTFGWIAVLSCATIGGFYMVLTGFSVAYTYFGGAGLVGPDSAYFFKHVFLHDSGSLSHIGGLAIGVFASTLVVATFTWWVLARNIQSGVEKICSIFLPLLAILIVFFSILVFFLPGAMVGIKSYLIPDFSRLSNWMLWRDVFGQVFFSLSLGLGIVIGYSRHNPKSFSIPRAMYKVALGDFLISFLSGLAIFGCMGFMSVKGNIPFSSLVSSDSAFEIGFVIFPMILSQFGGIMSQVISPIFFFCIFIAGITGVFSIVESVAGNIEVEFNRNRKQAVTIAMLIVIATAFPFCLGNGQHLIGAMAPMVMGNTMLIGGIAEILFFIILSRFIANDPVWFHGTKQRTFAFQALRFLILPLLLLTFLGALFQEIKTGFHIEESVRWGWAALVLIASIFLAGRKSIVPFTA